MSDYLIHYGVKGMKWGVIKDPRVTARERIRKEGAKKYSLHYGRFGSTSIRDESSGKKMRYGTRRSLEKSIKADNIQKYREYKRYKKVANSGMTYVGGSTEMAMTVAAMNAATKGSRDNAKAEAQKILIDYGNKYIKL